MYLKLSSLLLFISLIINANTESADQIQAQELNAKEQIGLGYNSKIGITAFGIVLILIEAFVWRR